MAVDLGKTPLGLVKEKGWSFLINGLPSRLAYQGLGMYPSLYIGKKLKESGVHPAVASLASTSHETIVGTALELNAASKNFGIDPMKVFPRVVFPFYIRNYLGWFVVNGQHDNLGERAAYGFAAGIASAIPDSVGNLMMMQKPELGVVDSFFEALKQIKETKGARIVKSAPIRGVAAALGAAIISPQTQDFIFKTFSEMAKQYEDMLEAGRREGKPRIEIVDDSAKKPESPKASPAVPSAKKTVEERGPERNA